MRTIHADKCVSQIYNDLARAEWRANGDSVTTASVLQRAATLQRYGTAG